MNNNNNNKNWVYECLVDSDTDPVGLIAYAFYKKSKHDLATSLREEGLDEPEIQEKVKVHHDTVLQSKDLLDGFNSRAKAFLNEVYQRIETRVEQDLKKVHDKRVKELEKKEKQAYDKALRELKGAAKSHKQPHWFIRSLGWVWNGFSGVLAALIMTFIIGGIIYANSSEAQQAESKKEAITKIVSEILG